jgi:hypothetical protein
MMKKLLFMAALLVPGLAYGQNPSADLSVQVVPGSDPPGIVCAIGPNTTAGPTGVAATDTQTAGFTTCALNSDFSNSFFANFDNWMAGDNGCGHATTPIWYNSVNTPCSDYNIVTDGSNGTVLKISLTNADLSAGRIASQLISQPGSGSGQPYPMATYVELRARIVPGSPLNGSGQNLVWQSFLAPPSGSTLTSFVEENLAEGYFNPLGFAGSFNATGVSNFNENLQTALELCPTGCGNFDPTVMHTYGALSTTDGNQALSWCLYADRVPGTYTKLGCYNNTGVTPAVLPWRAHQMYILEAGYNGPVDVYVEYFRVWSCSTWNSGGAADLAPAAVCPGTVVNH